MKLSKILCLFLMIAVVFSFASCEFLFGKPQEVTKYTVTFDSNGGSAVASQEVEAGKTATEPTAPTKDGFVFDGWYNGEVKWDFANEVNADVTLKANWKAESDTPPVCDEHVDADKDGECDNCGATVTPPPATEYTITYMDGSTKLDLTPNKFSADSSAIVLPTAPTKAHYTFAGWYAEAALENAVTEIDVTTESNITLYAKYNAVVYTITYHLDGGENPDSNPESFTVESLPTFADPTRAQHNFKGWFTNAECTEALTAITADNAANLNLFAKWEYVPPVYTITFVDENGAEILEPMSYSKSESSIALPTYTLEGYTFMGWKNNNLNMTFTELPAGTEGNMTLQAVMVKDAVTYTVTLMIDGQVYNTVNYLENEGLAELEQPSKAGHTFSGWMTEGGQVVDSIPAEANTNMTLQGTFTIIEYTVKYHDENGEEIAELASTYTISETEITLAQGPVKAGHTFLGWYNADGEKVTVIAANSTGDLSLTAKYEVQKFTIQYVMNGGTNSSENVAEFAYGEIPQLHNPENRDKFSFKGWYTTSTFEEGTMVRDLADLATDNIVLYAKWEASPIEDDVVTPEVPIG